MQAVLQYMRCPNTNWNVSTQQKLVLFTDETNPVRVRARVRVRVRVDPNPTITLTLTLTLALTLALALTLTLSRPICSSSPAAWPRCRAGAAASCTATRRSRAS